MSPAARLMLWGMLLVLSGVVAYATVDWVQVLATYPHYVRPLKSVLRPTLQLAWYWAFLVPALLVLGAVLRFATAKSGRATYLWRLFAYFTLWALGSFAFFFGLFLAYAGGGEASLALLAPALVACFGYILLGVGFVFSILGGG